MKLWITVLLMALCALGCEALEDQEFADGEPLADVSGQWTLSGSGVLRDCNDARFNADQFTLAGLTLEVTQSGLAEVGSPGGASSQNESTGGTQVQQATTGGLDVQPAVTGGLDVQPEEVETSEVADQNGAQLTAVVTGQPDFVFSGSVMGDRVLFETRETVAEGTIRISFDGQATGAGLIRGTFSGDGPSTCVSEGRFVVEINQAR